MGVGQMDKITKRKIMNELKEIESSLDNYEKEKLQKKQERKNKSLRLIIIIILVLLYLILVSSLLFDKKKITEFENISKEAEQFLIYEE